MGPPGKDGVTVSISFCRINFHTVIIITIIIIIIIIIIIVLTGAFISNLSKSTQSAAGLNALKPAANRRYTSCANHYPTISIYYTEVHLSSCQQSACWVVSCFRNPPNSDMDYRIVNMRT